MHDPVDAGASVGEQLPPLGAVVPAHQVRGDPEEPGAGVGAPVVPVPVPERLSKRPRGKSIEEASRDTRIRAEYLQALEREAFGSLRGDVYVRGFLRSYSSYLGLNPDKVVSVYVRSTGKTVADVPGPPPLLPLRQAT